MNRRYVADSLFIAIILVFFVGLLVHAEKKNPIKTRPAATASAPWSFLTPSVWSLSHR